MSTTDPGGEARAERFVLWPYRSLSARGALLLLSGVGLFFVAASVWAIAVGAWPMAVYAIIALAGFSLAIGHNYRTARFAQVIELDPACIRISETGPAARNTAAVELNPFWTRVRVAEDLQQKRHITLLQGGRIVPIGDFLPPDERTALGEALDASIRCLRAGRWRQTDR